MIAAVHRHEGMQRVEAVAGVQASGAARAHRELGAAVLAPPHGKGDELGHELHVPHRETHVAPPHVENRRPATVVCLVHAEEILLPEAGRKGQHPVGPLLVAAALVGPEGRLLVVAQRVEHVAMAGPADDRERRVAFIDVADAHEQPARAPSVGRDLHALGDPASVTGQRDAATGTERIAHSTFFTPLEREVRQRTRCGQQGLRLLERAERRLAHEARDDTAAHPRVELQPDPVAVDGGRCDPIGVDQSRREQQAECHRCLQLR